MKLTRTVHGHTITAELVKLDKGWDVSVFGGCSTHVGAVTFAAPGEPTETLERFHHRDSVVSIRWAVTLSKVLHAPVCVRCGIHYNDATREQISEILTCCDEMLFHFESLSIESSKKIGLIARIESFETVS